MTTTTQQSDAATAPVSRIAKWAPLAVILTGTFIYILDFFVVNVALPDMQRSLHASAAAIEWLVSGYALTSASLLVCGGRLGDHYGRRRCFCIGLAAFVLASALCAVAPDPGFLIAARLVQGAGGAIMAPNIMSILGMTYTGRDRVRAISVYGMVMGIAAVGGQLIGGVLIDANVAGLGWRAIFWVNVPIGLVALAAAWRLVPESRAERACHLDLPGAALLAAGLVAIVLPLADGRQQGWPAVVGVPGARPGAAGAVRGVPAPGRTARPSAAARPGRLRGPHAAGRADRAGAVLVPAGGQLPAAGAVPAAGPWPWGA